MIFVSYCIADWFINFTFGKYFDKNLALLIRKEKVNYIRYFIDKKEIYKTDQIVLLVKANESQKLKELFFDKHSCLQEAVVALFLKSDMTSLQVEFLKKCNLPEWILEEFIDNKDSESLLRYISIRELPDNLIRRISDIPDMSDVFIAACKRSNGLPGEVECILVTKSFTSEDYKNALYSYLGNQIGNLCVEAELLLINNSVDKFNSYLQYTKNVSTEAIERLINISKNSKIAREILFTCLENDYINSEQSLELFRLSMKDKNFSEFYDVFVKRGLSDEMNKEFKLHCKELFYKKI